MQDFSFDLDKHIFDSIKKDRIDHRRPGFYFKPHGRAAYIYFVENNAIIPIDAEMPGADYLDILVFGEVKNINKKYYVIDKKVEIIASDERKRIQNLLIKWLAEKGWKHDINVDE